MPKTLLERCADLIEELGLGTRLELADVRVLTGGVASDIASLRVGKTRYCAKFALPKLKVAADWHAPLHRNAAEYAWLQIAAKVVPESAVRLFGRSDHAHGFVMEFVTGADVYLWKSALLEGKLPRGEARAVGDMVGRIHEASAHSGFDRSSFQNRDDFLALRLEPYLTYTAAQHPSVARQLTELSDLLYHSEQVLVHGDVSPKNVLIRNSGPVILDAECATMGDAAFDPAFCLNHLILKGVHLPSLRTALFAEALQFWGAYAPHITWENSSALEARVCRLLPALMLARIDGKSPVEYLSPARQEHIRLLALPMIARPAPTLSEFMEELASRLKDLVS